MPAPSLLQVLEQDGDVMGIRKQVTYFCDVCGSETPDISRIAVPVMVKAVDEYGIQRDRHIANPDIDLCDECLDRVAVLETNCGMVCAVPGEGEFTWRVR